MRLLGLFSIMAASPTALAGRVHVQRQATSPSPTTPPSSASPTTSPFAGQCFRNSDCATGQQCASFGHGNFACRDYVPGDCRLAASACTAGNACDVGQYPAVCRPSAQVSVTPTPEPTGARGNGFFCQNTSQCQSGSVCVNSDGVVRCVAANDCRNTACAAGQRCINPTVFDITVTNVCVDPPASSSSTAAPLPSQTNPAFKSCRSNENCPDNNLCSFPYSDGTLGGFCSPNNCSADSQCGVDQVCRGNLCSFTSCFKGFTACPSGQECVYANGVDQGGFCTRSLAVSSSSASASSTASPSANSTMSMSMSANSTSSASSTSSAPSASASVIVPTICSNNTGCGDNRYCLFTDVQAPTGVCAANNCTASSQCGPNQFCDRNLCAYTFCKVDGDCKNSTQTCVLRSANATRGYCAVTKASVSSLVSSAVSTASASMTSAASGGSSAPHPGPSASSSAAPTSAPSGSAPHPNPGPAPSSSSSTGSGSGSGSSAAPHPAPNPATSVSSSSASTPTADKAALSSAAAAMSSAAAGIAPAMSSAAAAASKPAPSQGSGAMASGQGQCSGACDLPCGDILNMLKALQADVWAVKADVAAIKAKVGA